MAPYGSKRPLCRCKRKGHIEKGRVKGAHIDERESWTATTKKVVKKLRKNSCPSGRGSLRLAPALSVCKIQSFALTLQHQHGPDVANQKLTYINCHLPQRYCEQMINILYFYDPLSRVYGKPSPVEHLWI